MKTTKNDSTAEILKELKEWWDDDHTSGLFMEQHTLADFDRMYLLIEQRVLQALQRQRESDIQAFDKMLADELESGTGLKDFVFRDNDAIARNELRAELRNKLDKLK